jgi:hypothetical protein
MTNSDKQLVRKKMDVNKHEQLSNFTLCDKLNHINSAVMAVLQVHKLFKNQNNLICLWNRNMVIRDFNILYLKSLENNNYLESLRTSYMDYQFIYMLIDKISH